MGRGKGKEVPLYNSITGDQVALASSEGLDFSEMIGFWKSCWVRSVKNDFPRASANT